MSIEAGPAFAFGTIAMEPGGEVHVEAGAKAAYSDGVEVETKARGGMLAGLEAGQSHTLDTGHVVAFDEGVQYQVSKAGNWKTTILGGEGLVTRFTGPGRLWLQTRSSADLLGWLIPKLPTKSN